MLNPLINQYVSDSPAIAKLTAKYGDRLNLMTLYERLLTIMLLSSTLSDGLLDANVEPSIERQIEIYINGGYIINAELRNGLVALDDCDERQVTALLVALIGYVSAHLAHLALSAAQ
jgi:hypothetical protein